MIEYSASDLWLFSPIDLCSNQSVEAGGLTYCVQWCSDLHRWRNDFPLEIFQILFVSRNTGKISENQWTIYNPLKLLEMNRPSGKTCDKMSPISVVVVGDYQCGKTQLINRFSKGEFSKVRDSLYSITVSNLAGINWKSGSDMNSLLWTQISWTSSKIPGLLLPLHAGLFWLD